MAASVACSSSPGNVAAAEGEIALVYRGKKAYSGFDNLAFWSADQVMFVEDAGDKSTASATRSTRAMSSI